MSDTASRRQLRSFGILVGGVFALLAFVPLLRRGEPPRAWMLVLGAALIGPALVYPEVLLWPHRGWMAIGHALGWINSRILLSLVFYLVVTPIGFCVRLFGRDPMRRKFDAKVETYRLQRETRPGSHMRQQF